jgi:hypothetical protein
MIGTWMSQCTLLMFLQCMQRPLTPHHMLKCEACALAQWCGHHQTLRGTADEECQHLLRCVTWHLVVTCCCSGQGC